MFLPYENFVLLSFRFLPRTTLHGTAVFFWSQGAFSFSWFARAPLGDHAELAACSSGLPIPPLLIPRLPIPVLLCSFLTGIPRLSHCPKALISSQNTHRKERGNIFCCLFRYLISYTGFIFRKLVMPDLDTYGKFCLGILPDILLDIYIFFPLAIFFLYFFPFWLLAFFRNFFRAPYLYPKTLVLHILPVMEIEMLVLRIFCEKQRKNFRTI